MLEKFDLSEDACRAVEAKAGERTYQADQIIFLEGDPGEYLGFLLEGKIKLYRVSAQGQEKIIHLLREGEIFGEVPVIDGGIQPLTVEAIQNSRVALVREGDAQELRRAFPDLNELLLNTMASRLRTCYRQISSLALKTTYGRIAGRLFKLVHDFGIKTPDGIRLDLDLTQTELANLVGSSRESVSRTLNDLQRRGVLQLSRSYLIIRDLDRLRQLGRE